MENENMIIEMLQNITNEIQGMKAEVNKRLDSRNNLDSLGENV